MTVEGSLILMILLQVVLIALNAIFASAEIAVISFNDAKLARLAAEGDKRAVRLAKLTNQPARFLATIQIAITLSGFLGSAFAAENFSDGLVDWLIGLGVKIPRATLDAAAVVVITLILSYFTLIFGELVPKRVAMRKAESLSLGISGLLSAIATFFAPLVCLLTASTNAVLRLLGIDPNADEETVGEEDIRMMVDVGSEKGTIDHEEKRFIQNIFEFDDRTAGEIATHRTELTLLWMEESMEEWANTIRSSRYTRYPVCGESADDVVGVLNTKDYFRLKDKSRETVMREAVEQAYFVPESVKADVLFRNMKQGRHHMAVVLDEYGGMTGIVTMNDLVQQLVGDFEDDADHTQAPDVEQIAPGRWHIRGCAALDEVEQAVGVSLPCDEHDTFNGLVFDALGTVPRDGSSVEVTIDSLKIHVLDIREHQVQMALVERVQSEPEKQASDEN